MKKRKVWRKITVIFSCLLVAGLFCGCDSEKKSSGNEEGTALTIWYTDSGMQEYLELAAQAYKEKAGVTVQCERRDAKQYLEDIYNNSMQQNQMPDLYLLRSDKLGRACMQGLAAFNHSNVYQNKNYCDTALNAASFQNQLMAYPLYFNTACMIYNTAYFTQAPAGMNEITSFSETAELDENIQFILYWDINDYFYNYPFVARYMDIGGTAGDDRQSLSVYNEQTANCLGQFQGLGQYFAIDGAIQAAQVPLAFTEGRTICILVDCDMVHVVSEYVRQGGGQIDYEIIPIPALNDELQCSAGAYTELAVVNGMSLRQEAAAGFAEFLTYEYADQLYLKTGHFAARRGMEYENQKLSKMYEIYEQSKQFPKLPETEDLPVNLEVLFSNVWKGEDIGTQLQNFAEKMQLRMNN